MTVTRAQPETMTLLLEPALVTIPGGWFLMGKIKQERTSGQIRKILSELILRDVSDPRLQGITITDVELDAELLWWSRLGR